MKEGVKAVRVEYMNGKSSWYRLDEGKVWNIDPMWRLININIPGPNRFIVPLDNVHLIQVEDI